MGRSFRRSIIVRPPVCTSVRGYFTLPPGLQCTWTGYGFGGVTLGGYSYSWSGVASGSGGTLDAIVNTSGDLWLTVTDGIGHYGQTSVYITLDSGAPAPPGCLEEQDKIVT